MKLRMGQQVIYKPRHIEDAFSFGYPNGAQPGFIVAESNADGDYFVRYWRISGGKPIRDLRTKANSELTPDGCLYAIDTVPQDWVTKELLQIVDGGNQ